MTRLLMSSVLFLIDNIVGFLLGSVADFDGLFASVVTTLRAHTVCEDGSTAVTASGQLGSRDEIVCSSLISSHC